MAHYAAHSNAVLFDAARGPRSGVPDIDGKGFERMTDPDDWVTVPLHSVAHGRAGDKGNRLNVSILPYVADAFNTLGQQLTPENVLRLYAHRGAVLVKRYDLPLLPAFNFVIDDVLEGGVNGSLNLDGHGKSNAFILLGMPVQVRKSWIHAGHVQSLE